MSDSRVPTEVELVFEVMPCNALRVAQEPGQQPHPCSYFRSWGTYHSYDYETSGPPPVRGIVQKSQYLGRAPLIPELLSGCRKAPVMAVGINPNLPGWWPATQNSINPMFDDFKQYAHYFRYREVAKLQIPQADYTAYGGGPQDAPPGSKLELAVPRDEHGMRTIRVELQDQKMYQAYQSLLEEVAAALSLPADHKLTIGEDLSYGNMIACPSAKWTTRSDPGNPSLPPMTLAQQAGIVEECFHTRQYFLRQLFQSLPTVLLVFSQSTANAFIGALKGRFSAGNPNVNDPVTALLDRDIRLKYGDLPNGTELDAEVIFAPHPTGDPANWATAKPRVIQKLKGSAQAGRIQYNPATKHLQRPGGTCSFCTMLEIGPCDYLQEIKSLPVPIQLTVMSVPTPAVDKPMQNELMKEFIRTTRPVLDGWVASDDSSNRDSAKNG
jgi:hypothetical protein